MRGFSGGTKQTQKPLSDYAGTASVVQLKVSGPIVGDQQFQSYQVTVGRDNVTIDTMSGYQNTLIAEKTYPNNQESYVNFLRALDFAGFTKGDTKSTNTDERGTCATGDRDVLQILNGTSETQRFWTTTCRGQGGTFKGSTDAIRRLFNLQVPPIDFGTMTGHLNL